MLILAIDLPDVGKDLMITSFGAVLGFLLTITVEQIRRRREPQKRLLWAATTRSADVALDTEMRRRLNISFDGVQVEDLTAVDFELTNEGNTLIQDHQVRFEFPEDCQVLAADVHPPPEREMAAFRRPDLEVGPREAVFRIGHFERGRRVAFRVVASGPESAHWKTISHNETGDVEYREGSDARITSDADHLPPFLTLVLLLITVPPLFRMAAAQIDTDLGETLGMLMYGGFLLAMFPHIMPTCRSLRDSLVGSRASSADSSPRFEVNGRDNSIVYGGGAQTVHINPDGQRSETAPSRVSSPRPSSDDRLGDVYSDASESAPPAS